jgi:hypothetical protein
MATEKRTFVFYVAERPVYGRRPDGSASEIHGETVNEVRLPGGGSCWVRVELAPGLRQLDALGFAMPRRRGRRDEHARARGRRGMKKRIGGTTLHDGDGLALRLAVASGAREFPGVGVVHDWAVLEVRRAGAPNRSGDALFEVELPLAELGLLAAHQTAIGDVRWSAAGARRGGKKRG